ncbi:PEP-CTERM sorting domain-containing protein [Geobacter sp.]|uniref:PEP-CTERM sorting domain-containing protein n=1 Tax=Geobacter sp. TaxID=46610 RepID=UPI0026217EFC|nr:PEP-CTERM sorting domain-containing protein [Geobacter sp.]
MKTTSVKLASLSLASLVAVLLLGVVQAHALSLTTDANAILANGSIDWGALGGDRTQLSQSFSATVNGIAGLEAVVSKASPGPMEIRVQGSSWAGNFGTGETLLWTMHTDGPMILDFNAGVNGVGAQIQSNYYGDFLATIEAFDLTGASLGAYTVLGRSDDDGNDSALFLGVLSDLPNIDKIAFNVTRGSAAGGNDFAINGPVVNGQPTPAPVPEPATLLLVGSGLVGAAFARRRRN